MVPMSEPEKSENEKPPEELNGKWLTLAMIAGGLTVLVAGIVFPGIRPSSGRIGEFLSSLMMVSGVLGGLAVYAIVRYLIRKRRAE